jgi:hypothetical protein
MPKRAPLEVNPGTDRRAYGEPKHISHNNNVHFVRAAISQIDAAGIPLTIAPTPIGAAGWNAAEYNNQPSSTLLAVGSEV